MVDEVEFDLVTALQLPAQIEHEKVDARQRDPKEHIMVCIKEVEAHIQPFGVQNETQRGWE